MSATVFQGTGHSVLDYLCSIYAVLEVERQGKEIIITMDQARESLAQHTHDNNVTADEAQALERTMLKMKLPSNRNVAMLDMADLALDFRPPSTFRQKFGFNSKKHTHHIPRGVVYSESGRTLSRVISNLTQGVLVADQLVCGNPDLSYVDGVELFQQMIKAGLAPNPKAESELYDKLSDELEEFLTDLDGDDIRDRPSQLMNDLGAGIDN